MKENLRFAALVIALLFIGFVVGVYLSTPQVVKIQSNVFSCPSWVSITRSTAIPRWSLTDCVYQDETQSGGNHNMYISVVDVHGAPSTVYAHQAWPDGDVAQLTLGGQTNFGLYGGSFDPNKGEVGAYSGYIETRTTSDVVSGMGLPLNRHVNYILSWQQVTSPTPPTPTFTPTIGNITPSPSIYVTKQQMIQIFQYAIDVLSK